MKQTRREFLKTAGVATASAGLVSVGAERALGAPAARPKRPNILFLFPDQHRYDWTGANPNLPVRTPNLDKLAARGVRFNYALTPSPLCAPARGAIAAGKEYDRCRVPSNATDYPVEQTTFYRLLRDGGYHVMGCGKFDLHKGTQEWGLDGKRLVHEWGFSDGIDNAGKGDAVSSSRNGPKDPYAAYLKSRGLLQTHRDDAHNRTKNTAAGTWPTPLPDDAYCDNWIGNNGMKLLQRAPADKPWFMQVNYAGPHPPWDVTESMAQLYKDVDFPQPNRPGQKTPAEQHLAVRRNYAAMITNIDRWTGLFVDELARRGELDNTIIIYSSDHGEMLGDHGGWGKSSPMQQSVGVPLVIAGPGVSEGIVSDALVNTMDIAATCLELAGIARPSDMDSLSLVPVLGGKTKFHRECVYSGLKPWRMVFDGHYKLIEGLLDDGKGQDAPLLFDLKNDPLENTNLLKTG